MAQHNDKSSDKDRKKAVLQWRRKPVSLVTKDMKRMKKAKHYESLHVDSSGEHTATPKPRH